MIIGIPTALLYYELAHRAFCVVPGSIRFALRSAGSGAYCCAFGAAFWHHWSRLGGTLNGILQGTRVVKAFHGETAWSGRFDRRITELARTGNIAESAWSSFFPIVLFTMSISTFVVWGIGGHSVLNGQMTIGQFDRIYRAIS